VIAIIGILAAVLVPSLSGYIARTKKSAVEQEAKAISTIYEAWLIDPDENVEDEGFENEDVATEEFEKYYKSIGNAGLPEGFTITVDSNRPSGFTYEKHEYIATYTNGGKLDVKKAGQDNGGTDNGGP
jgi:type II secretory pathway pseudopilin PulG